MEEHTNQYFLYCSQHASFLTKAIYVPWHLLNEQERADIQRLVARSDESGIIRQKFVPLDDDPNCLVMTSEFADINQILSYWDIVVDNGSHLDEYLSSEHEQKWLKASFNFNEISLVLNGDTEHMSPPEKIFDLLKRTMEPGTGAPLNLVASVLHLA